MLMTQAGDTEAFGQSYRRAGDDFIFKNWIPGDLFPPLFGGNDHRDYG